MDTKDGANVNIEGTPQSSAPPLSPEQRGLNTCLGGGLAGPLLRYSAPAVTMNILAAKYGRNGNKDPLGPHA